MVDKILIGSGILLGLYLLFRSSKNTENNVYDMAKSNNAKEQAKVDAEISGLKPEIDDNRNVTEIEEYYAKKNKDNK